MALSMYPVCSSNDNGTPHWWDHLHCAMSHYKFVLAIENTKTESYVTEKLFYALEAGSVPIYFGAPNVWDFVPPNSIIDASKFSSLKELASYVKMLANDPVAYAEYHAWRRCGILGNFGRAREMSLDTLPCRLCEVVSKRGGKSADALWLIGQCPDSWLRPSTCTLLLTLSDITFCFLDSRWFCMAYIPWSGHNRCKWYVEELMLSSSEKSAYCYSCGDQTLTLSKEIAQLFLFYFLTPSLFYLLNLEVCTVLD